MEYCRIIYLIFCINAGTWGCCQGLLAQRANIGSPPVLNFSKKVYKGGTQTWDVARDDQGVLWFANNNGLLEFDGLHWRLYPLPNGTIVRSVQVGYDGNIYIGGQGDFGYFAPDAQGRLQYHSLKTLLSAEDQIFGDVWDVMVRKEGVFFRTGSRVFRFKQEQVTVFYPSGKPLFFMREWGESILVQDRDCSLYIFENEQFKLFKNPAVLQNDRISSIITLHPDTVLVTTIKNGIFSFSGGAFEAWKTPEDHFLKQNRIFCSALLPNGHIALGTTLNGLVVLDRKRRIVQHLNKKNGLQNNTVLSLTACPSGGVWLGLDNGIDFVDTDSPFTTVFPDGDLQGTGYAAQVFNGKIYFGTNTGLYATHWKPYYAPAERQNFSLVNNSEGQVWSLNPIGDQLLMGHHEGPFAITGTEARKTGDLPGVWKFVPLAPDLAIAGHYAGLALFRKKANAWHLETVLKGLKESSRILGKDEHGTIWMAHPYRGIFRVPIVPGQENIAPEFMGTQQGLPSNMNNYVFQLGEKVVFAGENGVFLYDEGQHKFVPDARFNQIFDEKSSIRYLRQDQNGNIWYIANKETGMLQIETDALEKKVHRMPIAELSGKLTGGFPFVLPIDEHNVFVATEQGFIHFDPANYRAKGSTIGLVLQEVRLKKGVDSVLYGGHTSTEHPLPKIALKDDQNTLTFAFSAPDYPGSEYVRYAHFLEGLESKWSDWNTETDLVFNNLNPGDYTFHVKARNQHSIESTVQSFSFSILPPWYASRAAWVSYILLVLCGIAGIIYQQQRHFETEKRNMQNLHDHREAQHQRQAQLSKEAINRLEQEKFEVAIQYKTQELASVTMHLVQKNEILNTIKERLERLSRSASISTELNAEIGYIAKMMEQDAVMEEEWEQFSHNFDEVHNNFLKRLGEKYDSLSPTDFKLCAYLRMNLSSKEIAALMNISIRGVEASRYRLRKRLELDTEQNLTEFLMRF